MRSSCGKRRKEKAERRTRSKIENEDGGNERGG